MGTSFLGGCGALQRDLSLWSGLVTVGEVWIWWQWMKSQQQHTHSIVPSQNEVSVSEGRFGAVAEGKGSAGRRSLFQKHSHTRVYHTQGTAPEPTELFKGRTSLPAIPTGCPCRCTGWTVRTLIKKQTLTIITFFSS